jgi:hypothetical protein
MFLLRSAFWLTIVILLIPADPDTGEAPRVTLVNAVSAVRATVADFSGFCDRNPDVCLTGSAAIQLVGEKAEDGIELIYHYLGGTGESGAGGGIDMAPGAPEEVRGTLTTDDVALPWRGDAPDDPA